MLHGSMDRRASAQQRQTWLPDRASGLRLAGAQACRAVGSGQCRLAIHACCRGRQWLRALSLLAAAAASASEHGWTACSTAVAASAGRWAVALAILAGTQQARLAWDLVAYGTAVSACSKGQQWRLALGLLAEACRSLLSLDVAIYTAALSGCRRAQQWQLALALFAKVFQQGLLPNPILYSSVITACGSGEHWQMALRLLSHLQASFPEPDVIAYNATITACAAAWQWQWALQLFCGLRSAGLAATTTTHNATLGACSSSRRWTWVLHLLLSMRREQAELDALTYGTALAACGHGSGPAASASGPLRRAILRNAWMGLSSPKAAEDAPRAEVAFRAAGAFLGRAGEAPDWQGGPLALLWARRLERPVLRALLGLRGDPRAAAARPLPPLPGLPEGLRRLDGLGSAATRAALAVACRRRPPVALSAMLCGPGSRSKDAAAQGRLTTLVSLRHLTVGDASQREGQG
uniref:Pentatricopeptide repeat-containing protein, chloroplastic n=1 Tax=Alexandrium monilatum TaxID=311494 RepID=A0A7S4QMW7_9DINO